MAGNATEGLVTPASKGAVLAVFAHPDDAGIAAGPTVLVLVTNGALTIRDKQGFLITTETLRTFFAGLRQPTESAFDPRVVYDPNSGRFFVSAAGRITNASCKAGVDCVSHLFLAVSKTSSPVTTGSAR